MFVPLRWTPTWRFHTELYKFQSNVSANNSTTGSHTDLKLREVVLLCIFYNITNSWLISFTGFDFKILLKFSSIYVYTSAILKRAFQRTRLYVIVTVVGIFKIIFFVVRLFSASLWT